MNADVLQIAFVAAVVISYGIERILKPLMVVLEGLGDALIQKDAHNLNVGLLALYHLWPFYISLAMGGWMAWYTGIDFLPVFSVAPLVGRVVSCLFLGMGPAVLYDLVTLVSDWLKKLAGKA
jgi:hypothetical protein